MILVTGLLLSLSFFTCILKSDDKSDPAPSELSTKGVSIDTRDISDVNAMDSTYIVTTSQSRECQNGMLITVTETDTTYYELAQGKMYIWANEDCSRIILYGDSGTTPTSAVGTWTTTFELDTINPAGCTDEDNIQEMLPYMSDPSGTVVITESTLDMDFDGKLCIARYMADEMEKGNFDFGDPGPSMPASMGNPQPTQISATDCSRLTYTMFEGGMDMPVSMTFYEAGQDKIGMSVTMGNCSVKDTIPAFGAEPETCDDEPFGSSPEFQECMMKYMFENSCMADYLLESNPEELGYMTKVDCNTLKMAYPGTDVEIFYKFEYAPGGMNMTITAGHCTTTMYRSFDGTTEDPMDPAFEACVEQLLGPYVTQQPMLKKAISRLLL
jgi:hypothetical protein